MYVYVLLVQIRDHVGVLLMMVAWCVTEVIRYCFYMMALVGDVYYFLQWARCADLFHLHYLTDMFLQTFSEKNVWTNNTC